MEFAVFGEQMAIPWRRQDLALLCSQLHNTALGVSSILGQEMSMGRVTAAEVGGTEKRSMVDGEVVVAESLDIQLVEGYGGVSRSEYCGGLGYVAHIQ